MGLYSVHGKLQSPDKQERQCMQLYGRCPEGLRYELLLVRQLSKDLLDVDPLTPAVRTWIAGSHCHQRGRAAVVMCQPTEYIPDAELVAFREAVRVGLDRGGARGWLRLTRTHRVTVTRHG